MANSSGLNERTSRTSLRGIATLYQGSIVLGFVLLRSARCQDLMSEVVAQELRPRLQKAEKCVRRDGDHVPWAIISVRTIEQKLLHDPGLVEGAVTAIGSNNIPMSERIAERLPDPSCFPPEDGVRPKRLFPRLVTIRRLPPLWRGYVTHNPAT